VTAFLDQHRRFENTVAQLLGVACSLWDKEGRAAKEVLGALEGTDLPLLPTRIPMSRRVPSSTLAKRPVVLSAPTSSVALAYAGLAEDVLAAYEGLSSRRTT
jgi:chromosome partitioning protein